ncbi:bacteriocin propeptide, TIGR03798 family [Desulfovibrio sp. X2]|uniref:Nif11-like leader peptide family natural product precursor n=1 Tax=Desulfovibrio sp. X2 TaxID=941449 RepID=UPI00035882A2|nr:Nif11-like leader peptide family natural product precursor [Desulfovibrio sp. X2]EPR41952.1 bacteriocin propeptide, TIGR03798 family [Desulfovibrio sp. X2]
MSIESAKAYMQRMRDDAAFKAAVEDRADHEARWEYIRSEGYDFTFREFDAAQVELMAALGTDEPVKGKG